MLSDLQICDLLIDQYNGTNGVFDIIQKTDGVDWALKRFVDCTLIAFEGSHDIPDWIRDFEALMRPSIYGGWAEDGFERGIANTIATVLSLNVRRDIPFICAGHSLGAAHAHIFARGLIASGFNPIMVRRVCFGSPRVGNKDFCTGLNNSPVTSYRNYGNFFDQDYVCCVPKYIPLLAPYKHPGDYTYIDVPAQPDDPWLFLRRHHIQLYRQGIA